MEQCKMHEGHEARIAQNEKSIEMINQLLEKIRNRLPVWGTALISLLTLFIGWLLNRN